MCGQKGRRVKVAGTHGVRVPRVLWVLWVLRLFFCYKEGGGRRGAGSTGLGERKDERNEVIISRSLYRHIN